MMMPLTRSENDAIVIHGVFTLLCGIVVFGLKDIPVGLRLLFLVVVYNGGVAAWGFFRKDENWTNLWIFTFILSLFQVFPDWFLSAQLGILVFPEDGRFKIGTVSGYMAGLWTIPLFIIIFAGERVRERISRPAGYGCVAVLSLLIFGGSEAVLWMLPSWYARNVFMIGHVAVYILIPEIILGLSAYYVYQIVRTSPLWIKIPAAFLVMQLYLGSAAFFYFLVEKVILS